MTKNGNANKEINGRDERNGRFLVHASPGRKVGSRVKLSEDFLRDLHRRWKRSGEKALEKMAESDPSSFVRVCASVLPKESLAEVNVNVGLFDRARTFGEAYRFALEHIDADADDDLIEVEANGGD